MNYIVYLILAQKLYNIIFMRKWLQDLNEMSIHLWQDLKAILVNFLMAKINALAILTKICSWNQNEGIKWKHYEYQGFY